MIYKKHKVLSMLLLLIIYFMGISGCDLPGDDTKNTTGSSTTSGDTTGSGITGAVININGNWSGTFQETWTDDSYHPKLTSGKLGINFMQNNNTLTLTCQWEGVNVTDRGICNYSNGIINGNNLTWTNIGDIYDSNGSGTSTDHGKGTINGNVISGTFENIFKNNQRTGYRGGTFYITKQ